jgi:tRNA wybutosine-synthesizing protein 2
MGFRELLSKKLKVPNPELLPRGYQEIGDIIVLRLKQIHEPYEKEIVKAVHELTGKRVAVWKEVKGELRKPEIKVYFGDGVTVRKEYDCVFKLDITKVMYSKGNVGEKGRLLKLVKDGEKILDMFAGIGYFSIILAKHRNVTIHAIEKNIDAYFFLVDNIYLNHVYNITPLFGDNREVIPLLKQKGESYDRILMGYLPSSQKFLDYALMVAENTTIHLHEVLKKEDIEDFKKHIINRIEEKKFSAEILNIRNVKSYAPHRYHVVFDIKVTKT